MTENGTAPPTRSHRPDIEGLRALAVLLVIAFHLGIPGISGGFAGVDVFFVISGYLITGTLNSDIDGARFSLLAFYDRRIRRILPALFAMLLITGILAWALMLPTDLQDFGGSLVSAVLSVANIYFWSQSGYFEAGSSTRPLLHTWSLGVEEQFYIALPLLLWVLRSRTRNYLRPLASIALCSFIAGVAMTSVAPDAAFYLLPSRAWELLLGSLLAGVLLPRVTVGLRNGMALAGLILIVGAGVFFSEATPFPGLAALAPCLGAGLLIAAGGSGPSLVSRVLSLRPIVFVGRISYSLYLWHWPLIVFQRTNGLPPRIARFFFVPLLFGVAALSWRYVEQPFRQGRRRPGRARLFLFAAAGIATAMAAGLLFVLSGGLPARFPPDVVRIASFLKYDPTASFRTGQCFEAGVPPPACLATKAGRKNYLLFGDSYAAQLWSGLSTVFPDINFMQATAPGCLPVPGARDLVPHCGEMVNYILNDYLRKTPVDDLIVAGNWEPADLPLLSKAIVIMKRRVARIIVIGPIFSYNAPLPRLLATAIMRRSPDVVENAFKRGAENLDSRMASMAQLEWHVQYVSLLRMFCDGPRCPAYAPVGAPMQFDYGHLTRDGSVVVATALRDRGDLR